MREFVRMSTPALTIEPSTSFLSPRGGSNSWAQSHDNIKAWKRRSFVDVMPLTLEYAPVLDCNAGCPTCSYGHARFEAKTDRWKWGECAEPNDTTVATRETAMRVLQVSAAAGVRGVLWTGGGEPTLFQPLIDLLRYSAQLKMVNALYTNGFSLGVRTGLAQQFVSPDNGLVFVRVSVNALSPRAVQTSWGIANPDDIRFQIRGLEALLQAREEALPHFRSVGVEPPSVQISTIVDSKTVDDLFIICKTIAEIFQRSRKTPVIEDVMVVRPIVIERPTGYSSEDHPPDVIERILSACGKEGAGRIVLESAGIPLFLGFGLNSVESGEAPGYSALIRQEYEQRDVSWANGVFLTVGPDASVYPCMELNCNRRWVIGNLKSQSVREVYRSQKRMDFVAMANGMRWGAQLFNPFTRSARLDRIARAIIHGELAERDIDFIRLESLRSHQLLLD
jgi:MoaA/NifB/PqqE/SkfB family radical SAM enzyme